MLDLQRKQIEKSAKEQELLAPILYKQLGITAKYDDQGNITGYEEGPNAAQKSGIEKLLLDRSEAALKGELPVNPGLISDLDNQEKILKERLFKQLGPGWETSTPGIEALAQFGERKNTLLDASRRGDLTMAESLSMSRDSGNLNSFGATVSAGNRFLPAGASAGTGAAGYGSAAGMLASDRLAQYQGEMNAYNSEQKTWGSIFQGVGQLGGLALGSRFWAK